MYANKEAEKKIKKIRIFDEFLLAFGRGKIIFKETDDGKHLTFSFLKDRILDVHETIEGKEKRYISLERLDLKKFAEGMKTFIKELIHILKEIDIGNPEYMDVEALILPKKDVLLGRVQKVTEIKHKEIMFEESKLKDVVKDLVVPMKDLQNYDFKVAYLLKEGEEPDLLYRIKGKYFLIRLVDLEMLINKIFKKSKILRN